MAIERVPSGTKECVFFRPYRDLIEVYLIETPALKRWAVVHAKKQPARAVENLLKLACR